MKVVIITIKTPGNIFLANRLSEEFEITGLVSLVGRPKTFGEKWGFWIDQAKRHGLWRVANRYAYLKLLDRRGDYARNSQSPRYPACEGGGYRFRTDELETDDVNSDAVARFISSKSPEIVAVCGSNVLKRKIFGLPSRGTVNIHCGITPHYRSANPVEWALYNRDFERIGVTIHYVDEGVDTGNVIFQQKVPVESGDTVEVLYYKNIVTGADLMVKAIKEIEFGTVQSIPLPGNVGRHYLSIRYGALEHLKVQRTLRSISRGLHVRDLR
jgi:folate-dependent phosphoribosylglycinamide formyltransferase PurN